MRRRSYRRFLAAVGLLLTSSTALSISLEIPTATGADPITGVLNTTLTAGAGVRTQNRSVKLVGKANLNPQVCTGPNGAYQSCQGLFRDQIYPSQQLVAAPGAASNNNDDGDLDYDKGDLTSAVAKVTMDLTLNWHDFGVFTRALYFYDGVNNDFTEHHPDRVTAQNVLQVGRETPNMGNAALPILTGALTNPAALLGNPLQLGGILLNSRNYGQPGPNGGFLVYGPGGDVRSRRRNGETLKQIGTAFQLLDAYAFGSVPIGEDRKLSVKVGRQTLSWGESTTLVINSINQANPVDVNNLYRIGSQTEEIFTPVGMVVASIDVVPGYAVEGFYQLEWQPVEIAAPGSYFSDLDIGSRNAIGTVSGNTGGIPEDPQRVATPLDSPLAGLSNTTPTQLRVNDATLGAMGQYGLSLRHYFEGLGSGTEIAAYFMNYHSRLPYASFYAANTSCARKGGNARGVDATDLVSFLADCPDIPFLHSTLNPGQPSNFATDSAAALDSARFQLVYPRNIQLYGLSFNTTAGDYSIQGEVAYRPNLPLQVDLQDLAFAAFGPTLTSCHDRAVGCAGSAGLANIGIGYAADGSTINYPNSDFIPGVGVNAFPDLVNVGIGHVPGSARSFPSFVVPFRGGAVGDNPGCPKGMSDADYNPGNPCYIRGYEREQVYQFNLGTTRVLGSSDNPIGADQIIVVTEMGATWVPYLPSLDRLQFEAPGTYYHASAGADGSGADGSRMACSTSVACSVGPDGLRFNPHQQDAAGYPDKFSWGYRVIGLLSYENVLPTLGLRPSVIWSQDVQGTSPGPGGNFVAGRKQTDVRLEARFKQALSLTLGYTWFFGGGVYNTLSDRDYAQAFIKYQF